MLAVRCLSSTVRHSPLTTCCLLFAIPSLIWLALFVWYLSSTCPQYLTYLCRHVGTYKECLFIFAVPASHGLKLEIPSGPLSTQDLHAAFIPLTLSVSVKKRTTGRRKQGGSSSWIAAMPIWCLKFLHPICPVRPMFARCSPDVRPVRPVRPTGCLGLKLSFYGR